jgi:hypothetical protein
LSANYPLVPEDLEFGQGIDSMSLNPDSVGDTWLSTGELLMRGMAIAMQYVMRTLPPRSRVDVLSMIAAEIQPRGAPS